jgi:hypothetical protein
MNMEKLPFIPPHAQDRIRQRFGIESLKAMRTWVLTKVNEGRLLRTQTDGREVFVNGSIEFVIDPSNNAVITVIERDILASYAEEFGGVVIRKARRVLKAKERLFRKAEINVAEITLNMLKCRNPKIKAKLNADLTVANDEKSNLETEITVIKKAARSYGVEV